MPEFQQTLFSVERRSLADTKTLSLFPLSTVLFPRGKLPLRIFEPRYVDMVKKCMRMNRGFGILLIQKGAEVRKEVSDAPLRFAGLGTEAKIVDFDQIEGNLLGILVEGVRRFRLVRSWEEEDHLLVGDIDYIEEEPSSELAKEDHNLVRILEELTKHPLVEKLNLNIDYSNAVEVSYRLAELLPIDPVIKQFLLELETAENRISELKKLLDGFQKQ